MPNKKTKTTKSIPPKKRRNRIVILIFSVIAGLALMYAVGIAVISAIRLESAGSKLNQMRAEVLKSGIDVALYRDKYCWRTQEKFSNGSRSCVQRLIIVGQNKPVDVQHIEKQTLKNHIVSIFENNTIDNEFNTFNERGSIFENYLLKNPGLTSNCLLNHRAYSDMDDNDDNDNNILSRNVYALDIICSEYMPTLGLYPYRGHGFPSWETYVDPT